MSGIPSFILTGVEFTGAALTAATLVGVVFVKPFRAVWRKFSLILDDWAGEPARPGVPERPGVMRRFELLEETQRVIHGELAEAKRALTVQDQQVASALSKLGGMLTTVHGELTPNGGGSIKDQVTRTDATVNPDSSIPRRHEEGP